MTSVCITFGDLAEKAQKLTGGDVLAVGDIEKGLLRAISGIREKRYRSASFLVRDIRYQGTMIKYKLLLLMSRAAEKKIVDLNGASIDVSLSRFVFRDLPLLAAEIAASIAVLAYTGIYVRLPRRAGGAGVSGQMIRKIAYLRTDHWFGVSAGGSVGHTAGVANGLRDLGYGLFFISTDRLRLIDEKKTPVYVVTPSYSFFNSLREMPEIAYNFRLVREGLRIFATERPDLVYQRYSLNNYAGLVLSKKAGLPLVIEYNGSFLWTGKHWEGGRSFPRLTGAIEMTNLRHADLVVVVSDVLREELVQRGIPGEKILVNPNCVDPETFSPDVDGSVIRKEYGLEGRTVVGFIGTFGAWHGTDVLAAAIKDVVAKHPGAHFLFIGDGTMMQRTREIVARDHVESHATFTGLIPQDQAPRYLAACDILVSPQVPNPDGTPFFGSPTKLFEYMAMGKAIVASDLDQIGKVLEDGRTALLAEPGNVAQLADVIARAACDGRLREELGRNARAEVIRNYAWKSNAGKVIEALAAARGR